MINTNNSNNNNDYENDNNNDRGNIDNCNHNKDLKHRVSQ